MLSILSASFITKCFKKRERFIYALFIAFYWAIHCVIHNHLSYFAVRYSKALTIAFAYLFAFLSGYASVTQICRHTSGNKNGVTISHAKSSSLRLKNLLRDVLTRGGFTIMETKNAACYYGLHIGCVNTYNDPNCRKCAERLTKAVHQVLRPTAPNNAETHFNDGKTLLMMSIV